MKQIDTPTEIIVDAIRNISNTIYDLKIANDFIAGETTRIMNTYCHYIGTELEKKNYKWVYDSARFVCDQCEEIDPMIDELAKLIGNLMEVMQEEE